MGLRSAILALIAMLGWSSAQGIAAGVVAPVARPSSQPAGLIQKLPLTDMAAYSVGIHDRLPTTILLPQVPQAFTGVGFTKDKSTAAPVYIEHTPGTPWFTVRALMPDAEADLNMLMAGRVYTFHFFLSNTPLRTLTLFVPQISASSRPLSTAHIITVKRLIEILDEAKAYLTVRSLHPNLYRPIEFAAPGAKTSYRDFDIVTDMVFKFPSDDTLVFRVVFLNHTEEPLRYDPQVVGARVRGTPSTFWKSISDLDGVVPAAVRSRMTDGSVVLKPGQSFGYFAITGNPDGSLAGLSIKNAFDILVKRQPLPAGATSALSSEATPVPVDPASA